MPDNNDWGQLGLGLAGQVGGGIIGAGMGMLMEGHNDRRQLEQERKLQEIQMENAKKMADYNQGLAMQMWKDTNYPAQVEMLKEAGLNPGLLYGKGGPGGSTAGAGVAGMPSSGGAPKGGGEGMGMMMANMQMGLVAAQTEKVKAEAEKIKGVDTELGQSQIAQIAQGITESKAKTALLQIDADIANIDKEIAGRTKEDQVDIITGEASMATYAAIRAGRQNGIEASTVNAVIGTIKAEYIGALLRNTLTQAQTGLVGEQTKTEGERRFLTREQSRQIGQQIMQGWDTLNNDQRRMRIAEAIKDYSQNEGQALDMMEQAVDGIMRGGGGGPRNKQTWERQTDEHGNTRSTERYEKYGR